MISRDEYLAALDIVEAYHIQIVLGDSSKPNKNRFKEWDEVQFGDFVECTSLYASVTELTIGKKYEVLEVFHDTIQILNDKGVKRTYRFYCSMFKPLK